MHAKVIILDGTLSHITDVCLFVKEKDSRESITQWWAKKKLPIYLK